MKKTSKAKNRHSHGAGSIYRHIVETNVFGIADRIKLEKKGNARRSRK